MSGFVNLNIDDMEQIVMLEKTCFPIDHYTKETFKEMMNDVRTSVLGIKEDEKLSAMMFLYDWKGEKEFLKIINIAVHPDYRNNQYATKLIQHSVDVMRKSNLGKMKSETRQSNLAMQRVFENCGFTKELEVEEYYTKPVETAYIYVLNSE